MTVLDAAPDREPASPTPPVGLLTILVFTVVLAVAPVVYGLVAFEGAWGKMLRPPIARHVIFECAANGLVMLGSMRLAGRLDQRLSDIMRRTAIVHGALAFFTLIARHYYSIPMLLTGAPMSVLGGVAVMAIRGRTTAPRVGILGPWHWIAEDRALRCRTVDDPAARIGGFDLILITFEGALPATWTPLLSRALLAGKPVRHIAEYVEEARGVVSIDHFDLDHLPAAGPAGYRAPKRLLDIVFAVAALPVVLPIGLLAAFAILGAMGRPIMFTQTRVGLGGEVFAMLKLRTMSEAEPGQAIATRQGDTRITPLGRWLRRFRIDELPQFWNVLVGDMSLIGPRPEQPALAERYIRDVPAFAFRQLVRPGITGWAQVRAGYAADLGETRVKLGYDLFYLKNFSLGLDMQILARTVWTLISGGGAR